MVFLCLSLNFFHLMVKENQKPSELLDTDLGMTLMMWRLWSTSRSIGQMSAVWYGNYGNGPGKNPSCKERKRVMAVQESQDYLHDFPTLGKSMSEVVTFSSVCNKALSLSFHALRLLSVQCLELCHVGRRSSLQRENNFHISRSQHFPCHREGH